MNLVIKIADKKLANELFLFWQNIIETHWNNSPFNFLSIENKVIISKQFSLENLLKKIEDKATFIYIIKEDDKILGTLTLSKDPNQSNVIVGTDFQILPEYQGKKYGKLLAKKAITDIVNMNYDRLELSTWPYNRKAIIYYKKLGFFWSPDTSVFMKNYLPLIYKTAEGRDFFRKHDWYDSLKNKISLEPDLFIENNKKVYIYNWENNNEKLDIIIDSETDNIININYKKNKIINSNKINFKNFSGKGIKIGIIDSGIDLSHNAINNVKGGINILLDENDNIVKNDDYFDKVGHGTACAGIINKKCKDIELYSIKIFQDQSLSCNIKVLIEGINWAIDNGINIINLSLGTSGDKNVNLLYDVCEYAKSKGVVIVTSDSNENIKSYPSVFLNVIGVTGAKITGKFNYHFNPKLLVPFIARGDRQKLAWINNNYIFIGGTSFAAPHITAMIAMILQVNPKYTFIEIYDQLINNAFTNDVEIIKDKIFYLQEKQIFSTTKTDKINSSKANENKFEWIKKACIYPYNKEMHALIRGRDLLNFQIVSVADPVGKGLVGKDAGEVIGIENVGIKIEHNIKNALSKADTLILGHVKEFSRISGRDILKDLIRKAIDLNKNIFCLDYFHYEEYKELLIEAEVKNLKIIKPTQDKIDINEFRKSLICKVNKPIVGIFGTSSQQGKFTTQLALRRMLLKEGYNVGQIGTEPHSELFGFDLSFPIGYGSFINWPERTHLCYLHNKIYNLSINKNPDIIIVGAQSGVIPYDIHSLNNISLYSIAFLMGTKPDAYILTVNNIDSNDFIQDNINTLQAIGKGKVILFVLSDQEKIIKNIYGKSIMQTRKMEIEELLFKLNKLEEVFNIPATEVISETGQKKLFNVVVDYFSE